MNQPIKMNRKSYAASPIPYDKKLCRTDAQFLILQIFTAIILEF